MKAYPLLIALIIAAAAVVINAEDYYDILGIGKDADNREIRKAFKKLALKYHPDKSKEEDAQEEKATDSPPNSKDFTHLLCTCTQSHVSCLPILLCI